MTVCIVSGFPGVGKTTVYNANIDATEVRIVDSDSSTFDKTNFPLNYIEHIKGLCKQYNDDPIPTIILTSTHAEVQAALDDNDLSRYIIMPETSLKSEYLSAYRVRGSTEAFVDLIDRMWDNWVGHVPEYKFGTVVRLPQGKYMSDFVTDLLADLRKI